MILGSHNSWTFRKPDKWWMRPFHFITKCQSKDIHSQTLAQDFYNLKGEIYNLKGTYYFDLRLRYNIKKDRWSVAHGAMTFGHIPYDDLYALENLGKAGNKVYVRVLLEYNKAPKNETFISMKFSDICESLEKKYPNITFVGGHSKYKWSKIIYPFKEKEPKLIDAYSSMQGNKLDDLWPWLWAHKHTKEFIEKYKDTDNIVLMDFI